MKHFIFKLIIFSWNILPFKLQLSRIIKRNKSLKEKLYKDLRYKGVMDVKVGNKELQLYNPGFTTIENEIYWNGIDEGWEMVSLNLWQQLVKDSKIILDIGANTGVYSFVANKWNPSAEIFAFEPVLRTAEIFKKNLSINPNTGIQLIEKAVSNKNGIATFYDVASQSQYSASLNENMLKGIDGRIAYEVDIIQLDTFEQLKDKKIDLIKLDVEMHEPEAIEGMSNIIRRDKPTMLIEILSNEIGEKIEQQISTFDYLYFTIDEINPPKKVDKLQKSDYYNFLICSKEVAKKLKLDHV